MEAAAAHQCSYNGVTDNGPVVPNYIKEPPVPAGCAFLSMSYPSTYHSTADASGHIRLDFTEIQVPATCYTGVWVHHCFAGHCTHQVTPTPKTCKRGVLGRKSLENEQDDFFGPFALAFSRFWGHKQTYHRTLQAGIRSCVAMAWRDGRWRCGATSICNRAALWCTLQRHLASSLTHALCISLLGTYA